MGGDKGLGDRKSRRAESAQHIISAQEIFIELGRGPATWVLAMVSAIAWKPSAQERGSCPRMDQAHGFPENLTGRS